MDNVGAHFKFDSSIELPFSKNEKMDRLMTVFKNPANEDV